MSSAAEGTNAALVNTARPNLKAPFCGYSAQRLLDHYRRRQGVRYFTVPDKGETRRDKIDAILDNRFIFNHEEHRLSDPVDWAVNPSADVEWLILLHKFYYAVGLGMAFEETGDARYLDKWVALTDSWIAQAPANYLPNPAMRSDVSQVAGRRIQNWIYAYYYFVVQGPVEGIDAGFHERFLASLQAQVAYLCEHLCPARNHRTLELYAIFLAALVFPEMCEASAWMEFSLKEIERNMRRDLRPDGVHCEQSTDYHHLVLRNYLCIRRLAKLNGIEVPAAMDELLRKALRFSVHVHKPDGVVPSLSDGDARSYLDLLHQGYELYGDEEMRYVATRGLRGQAPSQRSVGFADSGYYILRSGWGTGTLPYDQERYLVFDCGPLGEGNHGHLDLLSVELAACGRSLVVDPGRYTYSEQGDTNWRVRFRGTAYHNTVLVDGQNQTRYCPKPGKTKFKILGPEPDYQLIDFISEPGFDFLHGTARSHEYEAVHERRIFFIPPDYWLISDLISAQQEHDYDLLFHLSEQAQDRVRIQQDGQTRWVHSPNLLIAQPNSAGGVAHLEQGFVAYRYGDKLPAPILRCLQRASQALFQTLLYPYQDEPPEITLREIPVFDGHGEAAGMQAKALSIRIGQGRYRVNDLCFWANSGASEAWHFGDYHFCGCFLWIRRDSRGGMKVHASEGAALLNGGQSLI